MGAEGDSLLGGWVAKKPCSRFLDLFYQDRKDILQEPGGSFFTGTMRRGQNVNFLRNSLA